jgi:hypothetical protein
MLARGLTNLLEPRFFSIGLKMRVFMTTYAILVDFLLKFESQK